VDITWQSFFPPIPIIRKMIDVKVYDLGPSLLGQTASGWDYIELDSNNCVVDSCKRQTTPVHELFHRVQYAYGYVSGTPNMKWAVEATASWSQKYRAPHVGDWMQRMNAGLLDPATALISRAYDACHFWVYLGQRGGSEWATIRDVWNTYSGNGKNMMNAVQSVIHSRIGSQYSTDAVMGWWAFTNFYKDVSNASAFFDYAEDDLTQVCNGNIFGPLTSVAATTQTMNGFSNTTYNHSVGAYGARYYVLNLGSATRKVSVQFNAAASNFGLAVIEIKNNQMVTYQRTPAGGYSSYTYNRSLASGELDKIVVVVIGNPGGGSYSLKTTSQPLLILQHPVLLEDIKLLRP
jgi:hypothetical protein